MREIALAWRLARRELRGGLQGFVVFLACLSLGVAAIATVGVINAGVVDAVTRDAAALLGGDIRLETNNLPIGRGRARRTDPPGRTPLRRRARQRHGIRSRRSPRGGQPQGGG